MAERGPTRVQMWAMAHPLRLEILGLLVEGPATASMLARRLGESSGSTSYHLRVLARAGAIVEDPELGTFVGPGVAPKFSATPGSVRWAGCWQEGHHNEEVFSGLLGLSADELMSLRAQGVV